MIEKCAAAHDTRRATLPCEADLRPSRPLPPIATALQARWLRGVILIARRLVVEVQERPLDLPALPRAQPITQGLQVGAVEVPEEAVGEEVVGALGLDVPDRRQRLQTW